MRVLLVLGVLVLAGCTAGGAGHGSGPAATASAPAAPPPPPPPTAGGVHLALGDSWTYAVAGPHGNGTQTARVSSLEGGSVFIDTDGDHPLRTELDADTLAIRSLSSAQGAIQGSATFDPPLPTVIPAQTHDWIGTLTLRTPMGANAQPARATITFLGPQRVEVPAGAFDAYRYHLDVQSEGQPSFHESLDVWFSPLAKAYVQQRGNNETQVLASYHVV